MSLNDLQNLNAFSDDSEEDEEMYIPIPFRFHDLAQRDEFQLLREEIQKNNNRDYNPHEVQLSLDQEDNMGFTPLHIAIMRGNIETVRVCLENQVKLTLKTEGIPYSIFLLQVAASKNIFENNLFDVLKSLIVKDNMETMKDRLGRTIAHIAAANNMSGLLPSILEEWPSLAEVVDNEGNSILHAACKGNSVDTVTFLMDSFPQLASITNNHQQNALHVCLENNALDTYQTLIRLHNSDLDVRAEDQFGHTPIDIWKKVMEMKRDRDCSGFPHEVKKPLVLVTEPYDQHQTCLTPPPRTEPVPPEQIQRCRVLVSEELGGSLLNSSLLKRVEIGTENGLAPLSALLRVHDFNYVMKVMKATAKTTDTNFSKLDIDTTVSSGSFTQARRAAQTVLTAVDRLATATEEGGPAEAFCCVRPPGHHIGVNGPVNNPNNSTVTQGFCLFNNVAIAAAYARATYSCFQRVAIIDFDIHHGNGTEDCVQHVCPINHETTTNLQNMTMKFSNAVFKPWKDEKDGENVFFASVHGFGKLGSGNDFFYPGSGNTPNKVEYIPAGETGVAFSKPSIVDAFVTKEQGKVAYFWREQMRSVILPRLLEFHPNLIFISAGFDGHMNDGVNNGFGGLTESDFAWATGEIVKIANSVCGGRVVSVLEGGYNVLGGCTSPLAQSVLAHVEALCGHSYEECDPEVWKVESEAEKKAYEEAAAAKGETIVATTTQTVLIDPQESDDDDMEEEEFDFDAMSEEGSVDASAPIRVSPPTSTTPLPSEPTPMPTSTTPLPSEPTPIPEIADLPDDDGSEDLENYEMPEIEEGEMEKIEDPFAETGRRKRAHKKVDYVALEAQLRREEEELKKRKMNEY